MTFETPPAAVSAFARATLTDIIPDEFWGDEETKTRNKRSLMRKVDQLIGQRRFETVSLHHLLQGFRVRSFPSTRKGPWWTRADEI